MIDILIKMADDLDKKGFHLEADRVDSIIKKIAKDLESDYVEKGIKTSEDYDKQEINKISRKNRLNNIDKK